MVGVPETGRGIPGRGRVSVGVGRTYLVTGTVQLNCLFNKDVLVIELRTGIDEQEGVEEKD